MVTKEIFELHADVCKALGHPLRIEIIDLLSDKELCFSDIMEVTGSLKSNLSQHLSVMVKKGILQSQKEGKNVYFSLTTPKIAQACQLMREVLIDNLEKQKQLLENIYAYEK